MKITKYIKPIAMSLVVMFALSMAVTAMAASTTQPPADPFEYVNQAGENVEGTERDLPEIVGTIIQWVLGLIGIVLLIMFIYGGVLYATSAGNEDKVETGKKVMLYAIIGVVIIALAFALTRYIIGALFDQQ